MFRTDNSMEAEFVNDYKMQKIKVRACQNIIMIIKNTIAKRPDDCNSTDITIFHIGMYRNKIFSKKY